MPKRCRFALKLSNSAFAGLSDLTTEGDLTETKRSANGRSSGFRSRSLSFGSGLFATLVTTVAAVASMAAVVVAIATVAVVAAIASVATVATGTAAAASTQTGQETHPMATTASTVSVATVAGWGTVATTAAAGHRGVLAAQHGNADNSQENRNRQSEFPIHPRFLQN